MPTVPGGDPFRQAQGMIPQQGPTPEQLLITAADMQDRGQLTQGASSYSDLGANLKIPFPGGGRGPAHIRSGRKRR